MTKADLIDIVAKRAHMPRKAAQDAVDVFMEEMMRALSKGEKVMISGFGTFSLAKVRDKQIIPFGNVDKKITVKGHKIVSFKAGKPLRKLVW